MNGDQGIFEGVFDGGAFATLELHDVEDAIRIHLVAGGIHHVPRHLRAREPANGLDASGQGEIADHHDDALVNVRVNVVDELVVLDGK
jgi:hypothetical protein